MRDQPDFSFVSDTKLRELLRVYSEQAYKSLDAETYVGTLALTRSVLEGLLTWRLELDKNSALAKYHELSQEKKWSRKNASSIGDWRLEQLIEVAVALGFVGDHRDEANALRKYGNLIHPYRAKRSSWAPPDDRLAQNALNYLSLFVDSIRRRLSTCGAEIEDMPRRPLDAGSMDFSWVIGHKLAGCRGPESTEELAFLDARGIRALVRLADIDEAAVTPAQVQGAGLDDFQEPVPDGSAPSEYQIARVLAFMHGALSQGRPIAVSCGAGCGRTGTILACYLITLGHSAHAALDLVIRKRPCSQEIRDRTPEQAKAISDFERRFRLGEVTL